MSGQTLKLEHSLVSLAKWESRWEKPFLSTNNMTNAEIIDYIRHMTITQNVNPLLYNYISQHAMNDVMDYIALPMTATFFSKKKEHIKNREVVTAEIIYYWMIYFNIPFECQKWHLNRLLTLINVCNIKNQPKKKIPPNEWYAKQHALNQQRLKSLKTKG